MNSITTDQ